MANHNTLEIYGPIGEGENTPEAISRKIKALRLKRGDNGNLRLNTPGGDCFAGNAVFNVLLDSGVKWTIYIDGVAASMGSLIAALPGARVVIAANAFLMIHNPAAWANGESRDMARTAKLLDSIRDGMASAYVKRTGLTHEQIVQMMDAETWLNAYEAIRLGFADEKGAENRLAASSFDYTGLGYRRAPSAEAPKTIAEVSARHWGTAVPGTVAVDDLSDLIPKPETARAVWARFNGNGKYAGRR